MEGIDTAIYLGHSMKTSAKPQVTQANFEGHGCTRSEKHGVKHIIFMSGIITNESVIFT